MKTVITLAFLVAGITALTNPPITGKTPAAVPCPNSNCEGRADGNYAYAGKSAYFVQCVSGKASCQACWPTDLVFKQSCNQCVYDLSDDCYTTQSWVPEKRYPCPDLCPNKGPDFDGNINDPSNGAHYVGCWQGLTVGCVNCPGITVLHTAPATIPCGDIGCASKDNGNFAYPGEPTYFIYCKDGSAVRCQARGKGLVFRQSCNRCVNEDHIYILPDGCCPDLRPSWDPNFFGSQINPDDPHSYINCRNGVTTGCGKDCPVGLVWVATQNGCMVSSVAK